MKKALFNASTASMIYQFNMENIAIIEELGYTVEVAANFEAGNTISDESIQYFKKKLNEKNIKFYNTSCPRNIFSIKDMWNTYKLLKQLADKEKYDLVHTQSPIGGVLCRFAFKKARKNGTKVIYTAHGFHFYKGAPLKNWLLYYPVEKLCSCFTDVLITINKEDYALAKRKMKAKKIVYIPGVGIDLEKYSNISVDKEEKRKELGVPNDAVLLISIGELNENKNHETVIRALSLLNDPKVFYIIAGKGSKKEKLENVISELGLENNVQLIGYRNDVSEILAAADIFVFPSFREGLGLAALEAMACGLPIITSNVHGINDYSIDGITGYKCDPHNICQLSECIKRLAFSENDRRKFKANNIESVKQFSIEITKKKMKEIYEDLD